jgi:uncharacterized protein
MARTGKEFLGTGWKFPVRTDGLRRIVFSSEEEDIKEAIWIILSTAKGERVMRPDFGCGIHDLIFAPMSAATMARVEADTRQALTEYEPRIDVINVSVSAGDADNGKLLINIDYRVRATNCQFNLVFPFYLKEGAA